MSLHSTAGGISSEQNHFPHPSNLFILNSCHQHNFPKSTLPAGRELSPLGPGCKVQPSHPELGLWWERSLSPQWLLLPPNSFLLPKNPRSASMKLRTASRCKRKVLMWCVRAAFQKSSRLFIPCSVPGAEGGRDSPLNTQPPLPGEGTWGCSSH